MEIYFDGGCAPNPGKMSACIVVVRPDQEPESRTAFNLGDGTNNIAEWSAVVWAAQWAKENGLKKVTLLGDSLLVVNQANGAWKIKSEQLKPLNSLNRSSRYSSKSPKVLILIFAMFAVILTLLVSS
jgi:ribonuclease HI